ncbi:MAG: MFS transporter [Gammaproteobacteria bacterium]|nr:MFS transporter [Gammaproteobacteria bacterium]
MESTLPYPKTYHTTRAWIVTLTASLFFFYAFIQLNFFNSIAIPLMEDFGVDAIEVGQLSSMYFYANAIFLFPAGMLLDRFSTKKLLIASIFISTLGTFVFGYAHSFGIAAVGRFLVGTGAAFCFLACIRIASRWFPPQRMALVTGLIVVMAMLGGLVAQTPFALLVQALGNWREAVFIDGILGVVILIAIALVVVDRPPDAHEEAHLDMQRLKNLGLWKCIQLSAMNPQNWLGGIYTSLMNLPVFLLGALWGMHYLVEVRNISLVQASYATTFFFVGVMAGSPAFGWFSDRIGLRILPMRIGAVLSLIVIFILMYAPNLALPTVVFLFFLIGFVTSCQVLSYPAIAELNPSYLTSTAVSIDSVCIMVGGFIFQPAFGWLMKSRGAHEVQNGVIHYTALDFNFAMLILPVAFTLALLATFFMRETYCKSQAS